MICYHGSIDEVLKPDIDHSYRNLDFGKGFYVTTVEVQAERWARRKADLFDAAKGVISIYELTLDENIFRIKDFSEDLNSWIDFVCNCRDGNEEYKQFDIIKRYYGSKMADKINRGEYGVQYLDYRVLADIMIQNEPELFALSE